jgi:glutamine synthetase
MSTDATPYIPRYAPPMLRDVEPIWEARRLELVECGVRYVLSAYTDVHGVGKAKMVPIDHFVDAMRGSELFTGAALDGLGHTPADDELSVRPELDAIVQLPHRPEIAWAPGYLYHGGEPYPMCSRTVLRKALDRAAAMGFVFNLGIEIEFYLVRRRAGGGIEPANERDVMEKAAYDIVDLFGALPVLDEIVSAMNTLGWDVHSVDHEDSNSQFELDFAHADAMSSADRQVLWRMLMKEIARKHGCEVTVMPKPYSDRTGTGGHFNMTLANPATGENLFAYPADARRCGLSQLAYQFIAGVLAHAPALTALACPTVNSYKRLVKTGSMTGFTWAPVFITYGRNNRTHMVRIPSKEPRVESRAVDACCNPYLVAAAYLHAGLDGVEQLLDPGDPVPDDMYLLSDGELRARGVAELPRTLQEAVAAFERDGDFMTRVLGPDLMRSFAELKNSEWWAYHGEVSQWELDHYLTFF